MTKLIVKIKVFGSLEQSWEWLHHLDDLAFLERQLLISSVGVGWHRHGVVIKESHKHAGQLLWLRFIVVIKGSSGPALPAPTVAIWKRKGCCCYYWPSASTLAIDANDSKIFPFHTCTGILQSFFQESLWKSQQRSLDFCPAGSVVTQSWVSRVNKALTKCWFLMIHTSMPESKTENRYSHQKMWEMKRRRPL